MDVKQDDIRGKIRGHDYRAEISTDLPFRKWLYSWLFDPKIEFNYQKEVENWIALLIVVNLMAILSAT